MDYLCVWHTSLYCKGKEEENTAKLSLAGDSLTFCALNLNSLEYFPVDTLSQGRHTDIGIGERNKLHFMK
jgi:hypothetical protein